MEDEDQSQADKLKGNKFAHGHITSISVLRDYRKLGIATKLMRACHHAMKTVYKATYVSLHVRVTNRAAFTLYNDVLGYEITSMANEYYADKEDAYDMKLFFDPEVRAKVNKKDETPAVTEEEKEDNTIQTQTDENDTTEPVTEASEAAAAEAAAAEAAAAKAAEEAIAAAGAGGKKKRNRNKKKK